MIFGLLLKGFLIGFSIAMPVGPIGLLCIRNSLTYGMFCGMICGLGVFFGSLAWWIFLSSCTALFKEKMNDRAMIKLNRLSGSFIFIFGIKALASF